MIVLITGGLGYIGTELIQLLNTKNEGIEKIIIYDNLIRGNFNLFLGNHKLNHKIVFVKGELLDTRKLSKLVEQATVIFHLAAKVPTRFLETNPHEFDQVNNWGTSELVAMVENSPNVKKLIFASTVSVYGSSKDELDIDSDLNAQTFYGISKVHAEQHVRRLNDKDGLKVYILRIGNVYGYSKSMRFDSVINKFIFEANFLNKLSIHGNGEQYRSFIQIDRLVEILFDFMITEKPSGTFNLVENTFQIAEIIDELKSLYPNLERSYISQNSKMRSFKIRPNSKLISKNRIKENQLKEDLIAFKKAFTF